MLPAMSMKFPPLICTPELDENRGMIGTERRRWEEGDLKKAVHHVLSLLGARYTRLALHAINHANPLKKKPSTLATSTTRHELYYKLELCIAK
jgi:hypothetical protein